MKVLMFGWEFPPNNKGGLGTACYGLTRGLSKQGIDITLVLPKKNEPHDHVEIIPADTLYIGNQKIKLQYVNSLLTAYMDNCEYSKEIKNYEESFKRLITGNTSDSDLYGKDLYSEVHRYAKKAKIIALFEDFDVIHCHDWMTFKAGIEAKKATGKPLVVHVHATDFDRTGGNPNQHIYDIERQGMHEADKIITVSEFTKNMIIKHYGINNEKIKVVHNGIEYSKPKKTEKFGSNEKIVLFLGRLTLQKGPEYFMEAAKKALDIRSDIKFIVAGTGDMYGKMINKAAELGIAKNVLFTGHLRGDDVDKAYQMADLYVMPSVSEPFGITPLEALKNNTPVLISNTSGVSEVLTNALKVDFWDVDEMTNKIVSAVSYGSLNKSLVKNGNKDIKAITWDKAAKKCVDVYHTVRGIEK
ncbi:glycosyltransferase family 4 protein [archaeon]|nr:glycosyltransferase family 4 protein [archaeon]